MKRRYTRDEYPRYCRLYTAWIRYMESQQTCLGFPGETKEDFADTLDVVDKGFQLGVHAFLTEKGLGCKYKETVDVR